MQKNRLIKLVEEAGVVGAGGAGFPSHLKISSKVDTVIANGAECEPLLYTDQTAMIEQTRELVAGLEMVVNITGAQKGIIALKSVYQDCIKKLKAAIKGKNGIELFLLEDFYPCGDEHVLTFEVTGRLVPQRGIPLETGVLVHNVTTLINIYHASHGQ